MADIKNLNNVVRDLMEKFIVQCKKKNIDVSISQGFRSIQDQNSLYAQGRTKPGKIVTNARGGYSAHNYGLAFDFVILTNGRADWDTRNKKWNEAGKIGESLGLEWGGSWKSFVDLPHMQFMFGLTIADLLKGKRPLKMIKVPETRWLKELKEEYLFRVGKDIYTTLQRLNSPAELVGLKENQIVRIGKSIYKKLN